MGFDLRKTLGIYKQEREARQSVKLFTDLLGVDPEHLIEDAAFSQLSKVITKNNAAKMARVLQRYSES